MSDVPAQIRSARIMRTLTTIQKYTVGKFSKEETCKQAHSTNSKAYAQMHAKEAQAVSLLGILAS